VIEKTGGAGGIFAGEAEFVIAKDGPRPGTKLFVRDHFAEISDVVLDSGDLLRPGNQALVRYSGSVLAFGFGESFEGVLQLLLKRGAGHNGRLSLERD
jgi:hypothetical protein